MNEGDPRALPKTPESMAEFETAKAEVDLYSILVKVMGTWADNRETWEDGDPKEIIDAVLAQIPNEPRTVRRDAGPEALSWQPGPSQIEAYILYKVLLTNPQAFFLEDAEASRDSFSPLESIKCLRDGLRTKKFAQAIGKAVEELEGTVPLRVIDAGAGAIPIMGIYAALSSPQTSVLCLELNRHSAVFAREVVAALGLRDRITVLEEDATTYTPDADVDLLISETLNTGLLSEPLVDIMNNLTKHVRSGGRTLPDKVDTFAASVPRSAYEESEELVQIYGIPCPKMDIVWTQTGSYLPGNSMPEIRGSVPGSSTQGEERIILLASRVGLGTDSLDIYESTISMPQPLGTHTHKGFVPELYRTKVGEECSVSYAPGSDPDEIAVRSV